MNRIILALIVCAPLAAQSERTMTLRDAVRLALERNPEVLLARTQAEKAASEVGVAEAAFSASAYVGSGLGWSEGIPQSIEGATPSVVQATARKPVYDRGLSKRVRQAGAAGEAAQAEAAAREDETAFRVAATFLDFEHASRHADLVGERVDRLEAALGAVQARVDSGRAIPLDATRARLELARAEADLERARGAESLLETTLRLQLGLDPGVRIRPAAGESLPATELPESAEAGASRALDRSPELDGLERRALAQQLAVAAEKGAKYPRLDFVAQYSLLARFNNYDEFFNKFQRHNGQVGIALSVPVFTGRAVSSRVAKASLAAREAGLRLAARRTAVEAESHRLFQAVEDAEGARKLARLELDYARESLGVVLAQFEEGRAAIDAVERARVAESIAWQVYYDAKYAAEKAKLDLLRRTGDLAAALSL